MAVLRSICSILFGFALASCQTAPPSGDHQEPLPAPASLPPPAGGAPLGFDAAADEIVYFVMVDRFADGDSANNLDVHKHDKGAFHGGDVAGLKDRLPYLESLGVTTLWLTPLARQIDDAVVGAGFPDTAYHGYWPKDPAALDSRFADEQALVAFLDDAHRRGMRVILDVVVNHAGYHAPIARDARMVRSEETGTCPSDDVATDTSRCLFGLPDYRTEDPAVRALVVRDAASWARFAFDGFRVDAIKHVEPEVLTDLRSAIEGYWARHYPSTTGKLFLVGEWWGASPEDPASQQRIEEGAMDALIDFSVHGELEGFLSGRMRAEAFAHHLEVRHRHDSTGFAYFLDSHDVPSFPHRLDAAHALHRYPLAPILFFALEGIPIVTWGNEVRRMGGEWPENRSDMPWALHDDASADGPYPVFSQAIHARRGLPALRGRDVKVLAARTEEDGSATLAFLRGASEDEQLALVVVRRGPRDAEVTLDLGAMRGAIACASTDDAARMSFSGEPPGQARLTLPADSGAIFAVARREGEARCILPARPRAP